MNTSWSHCIKDNVCQMVSDIEFLVSIICDLNIFFNVSTSVWDLLETSCVLTIGPVALQLEIFPWCKSGLSTIRVATVIILFGHITDESTFFSNDSSFCAPWWNFQIKCIITNFNWIIPMSSFSHVACEWYSKVITHLCPLKIEQVWCETIVKLWSWFWDNLTAGKIGEHWKE